MLPGGSPWILPWRLRARLSSLRIVLRGKAWVRHPWRTRSAHAPSPGAHGPPGSIYSPRSRSTYTLQAVIEGRVVEDYPVVPALPCAAAVPGEVELCVSSELRGAQVHR